MCIRDRVSTTYDKGKWERALQANLEAFRLATGEGDRKLYDDLDFYKRNELKLPYAPGISDGDYPTAEDKAKQEDFLKRVMLMRYAVSTREGDGNKEYIWASWNMGFDITSRMPHHIIKLNNGNWQNGWSGVAPTLYTCLLYTSTPPAKPWRRRCVMPSPYGYALAGMCRMDAST